eukprot:g32408.t1
MDIQSFDTSIPHEEGLKALCFFLSRRPNQSPSTDTVICLMELVNNFSLNSSTSYKLNGYAGTIPYLFLRYIDDSISTASCSHEELEQFINVTNTIHSNLSIHPDHLRHLPHLPGPFRLCL